MLYATSPSTPEYGPQCDHQRGWFTCTCNCSWEVLEPDDAMTASPTYHGHGGSAHSKKETARKNGCVVSRASQQGQADLSGMQIWPYLSPPNLQGQKRFWSGHLDSSVTWQDRVRYLTLQGWASEWWVSECTQGKKVKESESDSHTDLFDCLQPRGLYSPPVSSVHGILQVRILEWVAIPFYRGFSWPWDRTWVSCIAGSFFTVWTTQGRKWSFEGHHRETLVSKS